VNLYTTIDGIALNLKGRQLYGTVSPGSEAERLCEEIREKLLNLKDIRNGKMVVKNVYRREDVFFGDFASKMPELIIEYDPDYRSGRNTVPPLFSDVPASDFDFQSGDHDENGIFIAWGQHINSSAELSPAKIQDMAPTILYTMGCPVPADMDGDVLLDIFDEDFVKAHTLSGEESAPGIRNNAEAELTEAEAYEMKQQLKALGYL
jgi:predicted AlkP superfamily phosphohydrolase/phosphomutase